MNKTFRFTSKLKKKPVTLQSSDGSWHKFVEHEDRMVLVPMSPPPLLGGTEWVRPPAGKSRAAHTVVYAVLPLHNVGPSVVHCHSFSTAIKKTKLETFS